MKSYTVQQFEDQFPDENACLEYVFQSRYGDLSTCTKCGVTNTRFYRVRGRKCYACKDCGFQIHPLAGTIFNKSSTPLKTWFRAIYSVSIAKNGVSAKEMQRAYGVCYETALRMAHQIKRLMVQDADPLLGVIEADETYFGGRTSTRRGRMTKKVPILGLVERDGFARAKVLGYNPDATVTMQFLRDNITPGSTLHTDDSRLYFRARRYFAHQSVNHSKYEYARGPVHTNTIEGALWGNFKKSMSGTHHHVDSKYLPLYVDEFLFRYNHRHIAAGPVLLELATTIHAD